MKQGIIRDKERLKYKEALKLEEEEKKKNHDN